MIRRSFTLSLSIEKIYIKGCTMGLGSGISQLVAVVKTGWQMRPGRSLYALWCLQITLWSVVEQGGDGRERHALDRTGMKVRSSKTEYRCVSEREASWKVKMQGAEVVKVEEFKHLGSTIQSNGRCIRQVKKRVQTGWSGCRWVAGGICDKKQEWKKNLQWKMEYKVQRW